MAENSSLSQRLDNNPRESKTSTGDTESGGPIFHRTGIQRIKFQGLEVVYNDTGFDVSKEIGRLEECFHKSLLSTITKQCLTDPDTGEGVLFPSQIALEVGNSFFLAQKDNQFVNNRKGRRQAYKWVLDWKAAPEPNVMKVYTIDKQYVWKFDSDSSTVILEKASNSQIDPDKSDCYLFEIPSNRERLIVPHSKPTTFIEDFNSKVDKPFNSLSVTKDFRSDLAVSVDVPSGPRLCFPDT